jgi:glutathione S-transferase
VAREARLYAMPGSHPCFTVQLALELKAIPFRRVEMMPLIHFARQRLRFGSRTVPGLRLPSGEKLAGSRAILRRLERLAPDPPLFPADPELCAAVEEAERWGDVVLQDAARRIELWALLSADRAVITDYIGAAELPLPAAAIRPTARLGTRIYARAVGTRPDRVRADLAALPEHLKRLDGLIAKGVLGRAEPNAADLQIAPSIRVLASLADVRPLLDGRPALALADRYVADWHSELPVGHLPADWLPTREPRPY